MGLASEHRVDEAYLERLALLIKKVGGNTEAARISGVSVKSIERYKSGAKAPFDALSALVNAANSSLDWLATGAGTMEAISSKSNLKSPPTDGASSLVEEMAGISKTLDDPEALKLLTQKRITSKMVSKAVFTLSRWLEDHNLKLDPETMAETVSILCDMSWEEDQINAESVERLMKYNKLID